MTLRTPRRRISPRTKRRYRAIRDFLRRALGTTSQPDTKTNSNISVNVTDLKHKIVGVERQLDQVSQHCQNLIAAGDGSSRRNFDITKNNNKSKISLEEINVNPTETKVLYKTSQNQYKNFVESDVTSKVSDANCAEFVSRKTKTSKPDAADYDNKFKFKKCQNGLITVNETNRKKALNYSTASYCSSVDLVKADVVRRNEKRRPRIEYEKPVFVKESLKAKEDERRNNIEYLVRKYEDRMKRKKNKQDKKELDKDFIADIIKRQYKPTKLYNRKDSGLSQLSAPLCRDQDFSIHENIQEGSELCSCCYDKPTVRDGIRYTPSFSDVRSICDARLYSSKRYPRYKHSRRNQEYYNDSLYDLVPVKEKSSPKSRRKFANYNMIPYDHYKEVPPSPRSLRPRLNLTAQRYEEFDDVSPFFSRSRQRNSSEKQKIELADKNLQNDDLSSFITLGNDQALSHTSAKLLAQNFQNEDECNDSLPYPSMDHNQPNLTLHDLSQDKTQETDAAVDKTDKALYEIKDILQTFLEEIKRETLQSDKSDTSNKSLSKLKQKDDKANVPMFPNSSHSFNNTTNEFAPKPSYIPAFPNPCCYPVVPICPINCVQNGFVIPTQSHTCTACTNHTKESAVQGKDGTLSADNNSNKNADEDTQQLIKEIYNFVKQGPKPKLNTESRDVSIDNTDASDARHVLNKMTTHTSRSVGASSNPSVHDVQVATSKMKCHSKSCEAFGSKKNSETVSSNASYSDTILEKLSLEAAATQPSDFDFSSILDMNVKPRKKKKLSKVLQTFGNLLKKRKKDVIEELSESESAVEVDVKPMSPYRQQVTNYMMHGEEYYHQPPMHPRYPYLPRSPEWSYRPSDSRHAYPHSPISPTIQENHASYQGTSPSYSTTFDNRYNQTPSPQVPLCLKEIEVKSIGTQSERKKSFMEILKTKMAVPKPQIGPIEEAHHNVAKMTRRPGVFNWKNLQEKAMQTNSGNLGLSLNFTQNQLTETDMTIRNTLIKRFFYKRNPFSPQNPLLQTLLGKDKPMEVPSNLLRTRMMV